MSHIFTKQQSRIGGLRAATKVDTRARARKAQATFRAGFTTAALKNAEASGLVLTDEQLAANATRLYLAYMLNLSIRATAR